MKMQSLPLPLTFKRRAIGDLPHNIQYCMKVVGTFMFRTNFVINIYFLNDA